MIQLTKFQELRDAIEQLGISEFAYELEKKLNSGNFELEDINDLVLCDNGIYHVKNGILTKVILHIADIDSHFIQRNPEAFEALQSEKFSDMELMKAIHKYHFTNCDTLQTMFRANRQHRYHLSKRIDGLFYYSYIRDNEVTRKNPDQKLFACKYCLNNLGSITGEGYDRETFEISEIYNNPSTNANDLLQDNGYTLDCDAVPNIYTKDWPQISEREKKNKGYKCQECGRDFSNQPDKNELHCHHINSDRTNNSSSNLRVLCANCHAGYHPHMRNQHLPPNQQERRPTLLPP